MVSYGDLVPLYHNSLINGPSLSWFSMFNKVLIHINITL